MSIEENFNRSGWTREQNKAFENSLAIYAGEPNDRWEKIAAALTGKTRQEIKNHYELLIEDLNAIELDRVPMLNYVEPATENTKIEDDSAISETAQTQTQTGKAQNKSTCGKKASRGEVERKKGIAWTADEHRQFLKGLDTYGKGDWRSISRNCVRSRTPTQVASHAQKYFNRLNSGNKRRKRNSIHDITCEDEGEASAPQGPAEENTGASASGSSAITEKSTPPIPPPVHLIDGGTSDPFGSLKGHMNEASAVAPFSLADMSSPSIGFPGVGPSSQLSLPPPTQAVYGFDAPLLNECSIFDISDVPFFD